MDFGSIIENESGFIALEGTEGMQVFNDVMILGIASMVVLRHKIITIASFALFAILAVILAFAQPLWLVLVTVAATGLFLFRLRIYLRESGEYQKIIDDVFAHGWAENREDLLQYDHRYIH